MTASTRGSGRAKYLLPAVPVLFVGAVMLVCTGLCIGVPCFSTGIRYGMWVEDCPVGDLRLGGEVSASGLVRGGESWIEVRPYARFMSDDGPYAWVVDETMYRGVGIEWSLLDGDGKPVEGFELGDRERRGQYRRWKVKLPQVPDGDYTLRASLDAGFEQIDVDAPVALYAPALTHVMTDRPLYKPGQDVLLRSVMLRRTDLSPLEGRPGRWRIVSPSGDEMLVERDKAGTYGVADTSFPLDTRAEVGQWSATWESGGSSDTVTFDVRPFRLPRFTVEATPSETWFRKGDRLVIEGTARYSSGAPVATAPVRMQLRVAEGRWPMPLDWEEPFATKTDAHGRFRIEVGLVPPDLIERSVLAATVTVTEAAGESAVGGARAVLSEHPLKVEAVTELGDGLVGGFNNRAYLRVTTPDGRPLPKADLKVTPWWDPKAKAHEATTDVDGVAALQLDPGAPVTVVIPAPPFRPRPMVPDTPSIGSASEVLTSRGLDLAERRAFEQATDAIAGCGDYAVNGQNVSLGVRVDGGGGVRRVMAGKSRLDRCVADAVARVRLPAGADRTYSLSWYVPDTLRPSLYGDVRGAYGDASVARAALDDAALEARRCMPRGAGNHGSEVVALHWSVVRESTAVETTVTTRSSTGLSAAQEGCVRQAFQGIRLSDAAKQDGMGTARYTLNVPSAHQKAPQATTITGYQLRIAASTDGADLGEAPLVLNTGSIPPLRIRATPTLAKAGDEVTFELIRGPDYYGELPKELRLYEGSLRLAKADLDEGTRSAKFVIPEQVDGFVHVEHGGARAIVWVEPQARLEVALATDKPQYRPGETATLTVTTTSGEQPTRAGVGLVGVDSTLGQLAPLLGPDEYGRVTVRATSDNPAFGAFDPRALVLGQVQGENAAKAAVLRITTLPMDPAGDDTVYAHGQSVHDDTEALTTSFYRGLDALHEAVGAWEASAPAGELMTNERMAGLWAQVLKDQRKAGTPVADAFGRELDLAILPPDLLAQVDPRQVVGDATRLPEDVIAWDRYVDEEVR